MGGGFGAVVGAGFVEVGDDDLVVLLGSAVHSVLDTMFVTTENHI